MAHANNAVYADWLEEAVLAAGDERPRSGRIPRLARLEYARAAEPGVELIGTVWPDAGGLVVPAVRSRRDRAPPGTPRAALGGLIRPRARAVA